MRRAAAKMRERAEAASAGPWEPNVLGSEGYDVRATRPRSSGRSSRLRVARCGYEEWETDKANAEHIASWDPLMAFVTADLLDAGADEFDRREEKYGTTGLGAMNPTGQALVELARTYLHEEGS